MARQSKIQSKTRWVRVIRAWKKSGLKASAFCRKNRLGGQSFYAWRRRLAGPKATTARGGRTLTQLLPCVGYITESVTIL